MIRGVERLYSSLPPDPTGVGPFVSLEDTCLLRKWLYSISGVVQWHPLTWRIAWAMVNRLSVLPAHDPTYYALRHFCVKEDGLFLDVGANSGVSARSFRKMNQRYRILSIEPNRMHAGSLERLKRTTSGFDYLLQGAGAEAAQLELYTPFYGRIALHTCAALGETRVRETVRQFFGGRVADRITVKRQIVQILPIDALGLSPDIIKIDVRGIRIERACRRTRDDPPRAALPHARGMFRSIRGVRCVVR